MIQPSHYLLLSALLLTMGIVTITARRHPVVVLLGIELMLQAASLACTALASWFQDWGGEIAVLAVMVLAAVQIAIGLAAAVTCGNPPPDHKSHS
jgi:NADH-quinone oxidoreductase subunit K